MSAQPKDEFTAFFERNERSLRLALTGSFGVDAGREATAEALAWAWQHWGDVRAMRNPQGYLYRVGRSSALRSIRATAPTAHDPDDVASRWELPDYEPDLARYLAVLSEHQRVAVWMVHGLGFSHGDVARLLECSTPTVATHVRRGLKKLRHRLGVSHV